MVSKKSQQSLRGTLVPPTPSTLTEEQDRIVINATSGLHALCKEIIAHQDKVSGLPLEPHLLDDVWKQGIFTWLTYLVDHYHPLPNSPVPSRWTVLSQVSCTLEYFIATNLQYVIYEDDKQCIQMAIKLWLIKDYDQMRSEWSLLWGLWGPFLTLIINSIGKVNSAIVREKTWDCEHDLNDNVLCLLILERLQSTLMNPNRSPVQHGCLSISLSYFISARTPAGPTLNRLIRMLIRTLELMVNSIMAPISYGMSYFNLSMNIISMIGKKLYEGNCVKAVVEAIECGLFKIYALFCGTVERELEIAPDKEHVLSMIGKLALRIITRDFPKYMHYRSVLRTLRTFVVVPGTVSRQILPTFAGKEWAIFERLSTDNWNIITGKNFMTHPNVSFCDNPMHNIRTEESDKPRTCTRCMSVWYCSQRCQREHWISTHRNVCKPSTGLANGAMQESMVYKLHTSDYRSACQVVITDVILNLKGIEVMATKKHPGQSMSKLSIVMHYHRYPFTYDITLRDPTIQQSAAAIKNCTVINCIVPVGEHVARIIIMGDLDNVEKKDWLVPMITYDVRPSDDE